RLGAVVAPNLRNIHIHMRHHGLLPAVRQVVYRSRPKLAPRAVRTPPLPASAPWLGERIGRGFRTAVRPDAPRPGQPPAGAPPVRSSAAGAAHRVEGAGEPAQDAIAVLVGMLAGHRSLAGTPPSPATSARGGRVSPRGPCTSPFSPSRAPNPLLPNPRP